MGIQAAVTIVVPELPKADVWFASFQAWNDYWKDIDAVVDFVGAATNIYVPTAFNENTTTYDFNVDGVDMRVPSKAAFDSLKAQVLALDNAFKDMRTQMKAAGLITNAQ